MNAKREIRAIYNRDTITVYQAYNKKIADEAIQNGKFGSNYNLDRMTWIKPSFLWMMYRCGWGSKENQECVLAVDMKRSAFDYLVHNAVMSTYDIGSNISQMEWKKLIQKSDIRVQWDPERDIYGNALDYRSIQLGLRGQAIKNYVTDWIVSISDISKYVKELKYELSQGNDISDLLPVEKVYPLNFTKLQSKCK